MLFRQVSLTVLALILPMTYAACDCYSNPNQMCCMSWTYEFAVSDVARVCDTTMTMSDSLRFACGINTHCESHSQSSPNKYCNSFSILADICVADGAPSDCRNYTKICPSSSSTMVSQCTSYPAMPNVLSTAIASSSISSICEDMPGMSSCKICNTTSDCNCKNVSNGCPVPSSSSLLDVLSGLCLDMPDMNECSGFTKMCKSAGTGFEDVCGSSGGGGDSKKKLCNGQGTVMYMNGFKQSLEDTDACVTFLFATWVLDTKLKLTFGIIGAFFMGVFQYALSVTYRSLEHPAPPPSSSSKRSSPPSFRKSDIVRFVIYLIEFTNAYALMLLAMTYFVGLFTAVVVGLSVGRLLFSRNQKTENDACGAGGEGNSDVSNEKKKLRTAVAAGAWN